MSVWQLVIVSVKKLVKQAMNKICLIDRRMAFPCIIPECLFLHNFFSMRRGGSGEVFSERGCSFLEVLIILSAKVLFKRNDWDGMGSGCLDKNHRQ